MAKWEEYPDIPDYAVGSCIPLGRGDDSHVTASNWGAADGHPMTAINRQLSAAGHFDSTRTPLEKAAIDAAIARLEVAMAIKRKDAAMLAMNTANAALSEAIDDEAENLT